MRILRMLRTNDSFHKLPAEEQAELMKKALDFVNRQIEPGKLGEVYFTPEMNLVVVMWDMKAPEETAQISVRYPPRPSSEYQTYNLMEYDVARRMESYALRSQTDISLEAAAGAI